MSYTNPNGQPQGIVRLFTNRLREAMIAELIAINGYQNHIALCNIEPINEVLRHIMADEKKHYGLILNLLRKYDPDQEKQYAEHKKEASGTRSPLLFRYPVPNNQTVLNNLREDIKGELEAVVLYEADLPRFPYHDVRVAIQSIINEEKGHAEHLTNLLQRYDPDPYEKLT